MVPPFICTTVTTNVFSKLKTAKDVVRQIFKNPRLRTLFDCQHDKESQNTCKIYMAGLLSYFFFILGKADLKIVSFLVICEILVVFVNTFTANDKYPLGNYENLPLPIQT